MPGLTSAPVMNGRYVDVLDHSIVPYIYIQSSVPEPLIKVEIGRKHIVGIKDTIGLYEPFSNQPIFANITESPIPWRLSITGQSRITS